MEEIKKHLNKILWEHATTAHGVGCYGELGDSFQAIDADSFDDVSKEIASFIQVITDSENQPNQFGIVL